jgi:23S rRNA (adenine2503-C2)-methyltransferase
MLPNIKDISEKELLSLVEKAGEKKFRVKQIRDAVFKHNAGTWEDLKGVPKHLSERLAEKLDVASLRISEKQISRDGSVKFAFLTRDDIPVEAVYMPNEEASETRRTVCVSTMTGCPLGCKFCATATLSKARVLTVAEILEQVYIIEKELKVKITNIVYMGMGEPFLNFENVIRSLEIFTASEYQRFSKRKITVSTVGIPEKIKEFADSGFAVKLAISLHATTNGTRDMIMPANKKHNIGAIMEEVEYFYRKTGLPITFEYILFDGINDTENDVKRLVKLARRFPTRINLIQFNNIESPTNVSTSQNNLNFFSDVEKMLKMMKKIKDAGIPCTIRKSYGDDIAGACGQLAGITEKKAIMNKN